MGVKIKIPNHLQNKTKGYKNHSQLTRFQNTNSPVNAINSYLIALFEESKKRNFNFNMEKLGEIKESMKIPVTTGQIKYEFHRLLLKLKKRDQKSYNTLKNKKRIETHPLFFKVPGNIESWEKI